MIHENRRGERLSTIDAYRAMLLFLEAHFERSHSEELKGMLEDMALGPQGASADPEQWHDWVRCVEWVLDHPETDAPQV